MFPENYSGLYVAKKNDLLALTQQIITITKYKSSMIIRAISLYHD
jgi:hypothetical protein